jgi:hypothetical protein
MNGETKTTTGYPTTSSVLTNMTIGFNVRSWPELVRYAPISGPYIKR